MNENNAKQIFEVIYFKLVEKYGDYQPKSHVRFRPNHISIYFKQLEPSLSNWETEESQILRQINHVFKFYLSQYLDLENINVFNNVKFTKTKRVLQLYFGYQWILEILAKFDLSLYFMVENNWQ